MAITEQFCGESIWFRLEGLGQSHLIKIPMFFVKLLDQTLTGWNLNQCAEAKRPEISLDFNGFEFVITSTLIKSVPVRTDLVDALNEFLLSLAYLTTAKISGARLLHCGAYSQDGLNIVVVGDKNAGKSSLVFEKAKGGGTILADDLLVWMPSLAQVMCMGLPLRMRRPVFGLRGSSFENKFVAGKQIAYAEKTVFKVAEAGFCFTPDKICQIDNRNLKEVSFIRWPQIIEKHVISDTFLMTADCGSP